MASLDHAQTSERLVVQLMRSVLLKIISFIFLLIAVAGAAQAQNPSNGVQYQYDPVGRVKSITDQDGVTITYQYDANGNRSQQVTSTTGLSRGPSVTISPPSAVQQTTLTGGSSPFASLTTTLTASATPAGGSYTYAWVAKPGSSTNLSIVGSASANTLTITSTCTVASGCDFSGQFEVTVTNTTASPGTPTGTATAVVEHRYNTSLSVYVAKNGTTVTSDTEAFEFPAGATSSASLESSLQGIASEGTAPYQYSWSAVAGEGSTSISVAPNTALAGGVDFNSSCSTAAGCTYSGTYQLMVTDASDATATTRVGSSHEYFPPLMVLVSSNNGDNIQSVALPSSPVCQSGSQYCLTLTTQLIASTVAPIGNSATPVQNGEPPITYTAPDRRQCSDQQELRL